MRYCDNHYRILQSESEFNTGTEASVEVTY